MLTFPRQINNIHKFVDHTEIYLADLDQKKVLEIDEVISDILDLCTHLNRDQIIEELKEKYNCVRIFKGLERLEELNKMGLIFSSLCKCSGPNERPNFLITTDALKSEVKRSQRQNVVNALNNYYLLKSIAPYANLYIGTLQSMEQINTGDSDFQVLEGKLSDENRRYMIEKYDGFLALSSTPFLELPLFRYNHVPAMNRLYSTMGDDLESLNALLIRYATCRSFDALVPDASWFLPLVSDLNLRSSQFRTIPNGIDTDQFHPIDKQKSKKALASWLNNSKLESQPLVGLVLGTQPPENRKLPLMLAQLNPKIEFLIFETHNFYRYLDDELPRNLHCLYLESPEDIDGLPIFLNSLEAMVFFITLASPSFLLLSTMACGIPIIVVSNVGMPEELDGTDALIVRPSKTSKKVISPEVISKQLKELMSNEQILISIGKQVQKKAIEYTWDNIAKQVLSLFQELKDSSRDCQQLLHRKQSIIFHQHYDKGTGSIECRAIQLPSLSTLSMKEGLTLSLFESDHTLKEIEYLLSYLYSPEEAQELISLLETYISA